MDGMWSQYCFPFAPLEEKKGVGQSELHADYNYENISHTESNKKIVNLIQHVIIPMRDTVYTYAESKASTPRSCTFRQTSADFYGIKPKFFNFVKQEKSASSNFYLPNVVAGHIFKHQWAPAIKGMFKIDDINDSKNCLFMYRPVEWAFDTSRLCIEVTQQDRFTWRLLDERLRRVHLSAKAKELLQKNYQKPYYKFLPQTFGIWTGKHSIFIMLNVRTVGFLPFMRQWR